MAHKDVLWGFLVALAVVLVLTPAVGRVARVLGVVDEPDEKRRIHLRAVPRLGGLAIFLGVFVPALAFIDLTPEFRGSSSARRSPPRSAWSTTSAASVVAEARRPARRCRRRVQAGVTIDRFTFPIVGIHALPDWLGVILTWSGSSRS